MSTFKYGKLDNGEAIHFITGTKKEGYVTRCMSKPVSEMLAMGKDYVDMVTCKKCMRYADYRNNATEQVPDEYYTDDIEDQTQEETIELPVPVPAEYEKYDESKIDDLLKTVESISQSIESVNRTLRDHDKIISSMLSGSDTVEEDYGSYKGKLKEAIAPEKYEIVEGKQFESTEVINGTADIIHIASKTKVFKNVPEKILTTAVKYLNNIKPRWENRFDKMPKDFSPACIAAFKAASNSHGIEIDIEHPIKTNPPRIIKRRQKTDRVIKRRGSSKTDEFGFRKDHPRSEIAYMIKKGSHYVDIVKQVENHKSIQGEKDIISNIKFVIRKLVSRGYSVLTVQQQENDLDYYHIVEPVEG